MVLTPEEVLEDIYLGLALEIPYPEEILEDTSPGLALEVHTPGEILEDMSLGPALVVPFPGLAQKGPTLVIKEVPTQDLHL